MTPAQRSAAAYKAAATKRARQQAARHGGAPYATTARRPVPPPTPPTNNPWTAPATPPPYTAPPPPPPAAKPTWLGKPQPTVETQRATVLVALEDLYALVVQATGKTPERVAAFEKYRKVLNKALAPAHTPEMKNENATALLQATLALVRLTF